MYVHYVFVHLQAGGGAAPRGAVEVYTEVR